MDIQEKRGSRAVDAVYADHFEIGHNAFEFMLDAVSPIAEPTALVRQTRIIISPTSAKSLLARLAESVRQYEEQFGTI